MSYRIIPVDPINSPHMQRLHHPGYRPEGSRRKEAQVKGKSYRTATCLALFWALSVLPYAALADDSLADVPENAHTKSYGTGWECDPGYREMGDHCAAVAVPANAFSTNSSYGSGWDCNRGYIKGSDSCTAVSVPPHARLSPDDAVHVQFDQQRLHVFDAATGRALT